MEIQDAETLDFFLSRLTIEFPKVAGSHLDSRLVDELGFDSLELYELIFVIEGLESAVRGSIPWSEYPRLETLRDAYELYQQVIEWTSSQ